MMLSEFASILEATGYPVAYSHFKASKKKKPPDLPFICYVVPGTDNFTADDMVYHQVTDVNVELYTDRKDPKAEQRIEDVFDAHQIPWDKTEVYIESDEMYQILYEVRLI